MADSFHYTRKIQRRLPVQQLTVLAICRVAEPLAATSLYSYLPEMIESFGVPDTEVGKWAGVCAAVFSLCQATMGIPWGMASDRFGRKPTILFGLAITMITSLIWGFSTSLWLAIFARAIAGIGNGNVGIIRTTVAEMVPYKELQPSAFSIMPMVWNIGSVFGPLLGGVLANPFNVRPGQPPLHGSLLERFPYALPNIVTAAIFATSLITGTLFLQETLDVKRDQRDRGLILGRKLVSTAQSWLIAARIISRDRLLALAHSEERQSLVASHDQESTGSTAVVTRSHAPSSWKDVLTTQTVLGLAVYLGLAMHSTAFDQILPVYMHGKSKPNMHRRNFLNFAGGLGVSHFTIGMLNTGYAIYGMILQFLLFPPVARRCGALYCIRAVAVVFPIAYFLVPFTLLMPTQKDQIAACFVLQLFKETCAVFAFPCSMILLTNSASSLRILGTVNGVATMVSAIGRAAGPALTGALYSQGDKAGYLVISWWSLGVVALLAASPTFVMVEGQGFGAIEERHEEHEEHEDDEDASVGCADLSQTSRKQDNELSQGAR